jgi:rhodanese-related sulfurtransferase
VFSYKTAVALKKHGFTNIRIYNGGLKDWEKSGYEIEVRNPLPEYEGKYMDAQELMTLISRAETQGCRGPDGNPLFTLLDYRTELANNSGENMQVIKTNCPKLIMHLDDFADPAQRGLIPRKGLVVLVCETGNRDPFAMRYLYSHGYDNVAGLRFGMRAWIKADYAVEEYH